MFRRMLLVWAISFVAAFMTACGSETLVTKVDPTKPASQKAAGVLFSLPETVVVTEVPLTKVDSKPGLFHEWTKFFYPELTSDDYVAGEGSAFKVGAPTFTTRGQTDPNNVYMAHIKAKPFETKTLLLEVNEDGIIARTETSSKDETIDVITSGLKTATSIVAPLLPIGAGAAPVGLTADKTGGSYEDHFKKQLSARELALYESLDDDYRKSLKNNFGFDFLAYIAKKENIGSTLKSANIEFFLTLDKTQRTFIEERPRSTSPCVEGDAGTLCMALKIKQDLVKALAAYDKIQELRQKRESFLAELTPAQVNSSSNLEFRLKELDAQIKATEATYFLGSTAETSATAKFEFKPTTGTLNQNFFTYAPGGAKPGICSVNPETPDFKALWPQRLAGSCHAANFSFEAEDFRDLMGLAAQLRDVLAGGADPVSTYLYNNRLSGGTKGLLTASTPHAKRALLASLSADLDNVVNGPSIYLPALFASVELSAKTIELIQKAMLTAPELKQLNRLLLEDTYSDQLYRQKSRASRQISLSVDPPTNSFASTVQSAALTQPGKRGFPYRVAATTLARLFDEGNEKGRNGVRIAQFGPIQTLPAGLGGRRSSYKITYYDSTGAIKIFDMSSDALIQKQNITDLTDAATTLRDAEAAKLKRETELLELKKKKIEAEKALKEAQGEPSPSPQ